MKNLSIALNIVLVIAVTYLYVLHFKGQKHHDTLVSNQTTSDSLKPMLPIIPKDIKASKIVFVNADSLLKNYEGIKMLKKETEMRQTRLESTYKEKAQKLQSDYVELQRKAQAGTINSDQAKAGEEDIMRRKSELDGMEKQLGELADETQKKNAALQNRINRFLVEYNKKSNYNYILSYSANGGNVLLGSDSLDITAEIVNGLNAQFKADKK